MDIEIDGVQPTGGDCGHEFEVPISEIEDEFTCPECGMAGRFTDEQVAEIKNNLLSEAGLFAAVKIGDRIEEALRGFPNIKFSRT